MDLYGRFDLKDTKSERVEVGRSNNYWSDPQYKYIYHKVSKGKYYFFVREEEYSWGEKYIKLLTLKSLGDKFIDIASNECVDNFTDLFDWLERQTEYSHRDESKDEWIKYTLTELEERKTLNLQKVIGAVDLIFTQAQTSRKRSILI